MQKVTTKQFTWEAATKSFLAEISDFGKEFRFLNNGDADRGLVLVSEKSKREAVFVLHDVLRDNDNDIIQWVLFPTAAAKQANPMLEGVRMVIFND